MNCPTLPWKDETAPFDVHEWNTFVFWQHEWLRWGKLFR